MPDLATLLTDAGSRQLCILFALAWLRIAPLVLLVPSLGLGAAGSVMSGWLSVAAAFACLPCFVTLGFATLSFAAGPLSATQLMAAGFSELLRGGALGLGCALPLWVFYSSGAIADAVRGIAPNAASGDANSPLSTLYASAALVAIWALAFRAGLGHAFAHALLDAPLGSGVPEVESVRTLLLAAAELVLRAFGIGLALSAPLLLASFALSLVFGLLSLLGASVARGLGASGLWPYVGLSAACFTALGLLERAPQVATVFLRETERLLGHLH